MQEAYKYVAKVVSEKAKFWALSSIYNALLSNYSS